MKLSNDDLLFRLIGPSDIERIITMINRDPFHLQNGVSAAQFQQDLDQPGCRTRDNTFVVEMGSVIVGYFSLSFVEQETQFKVDSFGTVDLDWRRHGIGTAIFKFIFNRLQAVARQEKKPIGFVHRAITRIAGETTLGDNFGMRQLSSLEILRLTHTVDLTNVGRPSGFLFRSPMQDDAHDWAEVSNEAFGGNKSAESVLYEFNGPNFSPDLYILTVDPSGNAVGIICAVLKETHAQIPTIAIRSQFQGKGIGKAMLAEVITRLRNYDINAIRLSVESGNVKAKSLYHKFGFQLQYKRVNYAIDFAPTQ